MKKYFTIPIAACLILISGMQFTIATHFCGGEIVATRISVTGKKASCGMVTDYQSKTSSETSISSRCCDNEISVYSIDNDYAPSEFHLKEFAKNMLRGLYIPEGFSFLSDFTLLTNLTSASPPYDYSANTVSLAGICVFRI